MGVRFVSFHTRMRRHQKLPATQLRELQLRSSYVAALALQNHSQLRGPPLRPSRTEVLLKDVGHKIWAAIAAHTNIAQAALKG